MKQRKSGGFFNPPYMAGIFGCNIQYTLSPLIHSHMAELLGVNLCYGRFDVQPEKFAEAFNGFKALGMKGANITQPYKTDILKYIDSMDGEAAAAGAVNTVNLEGDGSYRGYNTDITGFINAVNYEFNENLNGKRAVIIGAGGASRAALYALIKEGAKHILIINRSIGNANKLKKEADSWKEFPDSSARIFCSDFNGCALSKSIMHENMGMQADIVINTVTPSDESSNAINCMFRELKNLKKNFFFLDISYSSGASSFLEALKEKASKSANGLSMLLFQAIESFYIWTGKRADFNVVKKLFDDKF
jgi:shikimate dehydrogenase